MVGPAPQSQSQPLTAEDEALKRNTDCVYFLASPLTCKKGAECEYRHSDVARMNPRDCYFWMNTNCLNPKCGFRHPPLDGLLGSQAPTSTGPSAPVSQPITAPTPRIPNASTKPGVPCIYFQKGHCLKGDWCPFLHTPNFPINKASPMPVTAPPAEPATKKNAFSRLEKPSVPQKKVQPPVNLPKSVKDSAGAKSSVDVEPAPPRNEFAINRRVPQTAPVSNGNPVSWSVRVQQSRHLDDPENMINKESEEVSREPSPGFDVLVDDEVQDSDYYPGEDRYGMSRDHEARNEYEIGLSSDYNPIAAVDDERYQGSLGYDSHEHRKGPYGWDQQRTSSERRSSGGNYFERRQPYARPDNINQVDELDLRHRLAKHKKPNGLRSVISHEHSRDMHVGDRSYKGSHRDEHHISSRENPISSRLRGRISLPGRSLSPNNRERIRGPDRGRLSPIRANTLSHQGRIRDSVRGRLEEASTEASKNYRGPHFRRDTLGDDSANFDGPKSLAELKTRKNPEPSRQNVTDQQSLGKRKHSHQEGGTDVSFEGPKPLEEILKRKKRGETIGNTSGRNSSNNEGMIVVEDKIPEEGKSFTNNEMITHIEAEESQPAEEGLLDDGVDQESEAYEQRDGESDYEQVGGEDFDLYDGENGDNGEYADEDDDDDFAKKMGVMYS